ncbi:hypothetical protein [Mulberry dwarf phytoplasma]|uniref:hypothetical protein n=1 Tax=Mulberry dwarf phytoplasma TaxID=186171 RepID=UPI001D12907F|nr:hypothetical protein [Mulberry dwarf phytoplasma]
MSYQRFLTKNYQKVYFIVIVIFLLALIFVCLYKKSCPSNKNNNHSEQCCSSIDKNDHHPEQKPELISEQEMNFEELDRFQHEMQSRYRETYTKINRFTNKELYFEYESQENVKQPHALLVLRSGYSVSNKIHAPYLIFMPDLTSETLMNGHKYYDMDLSELKAYSKNHHQNIYIIKIKNIVPKTHNINSTPLAPSISLSADNWVETVTLESLDDLWSNPKFQEISQFIVLSCFDRLSEQPITGTKLDTVLYVAEDQENCIGKDQEYKLFIFVQLNTPEKTNKDYKDTENKINTIFNKKYSQLTLEDIRNTRNRKITIFKIRHADYQDKIKNPLSESKIS